LLTFIALYFSPLNDSGQYNEIVVPLIIGGIFISLVGFVDDRKNLSPLYRLLLNGIISSITIIITHHGVYDLSSITGITYFSVHLLWYLFLINAFNLIDGIDGLAISTAFLSLVAIILIQLQIEPSAPIIPIQIIAAAIMLGLLPWNLPKAKIFLGDVGSTLVGFLIAFLTSIPNTRSSVLPAMILPLLCVVYPLFDMALVVFKRIKHGQHPFSGDRSHLHHRLNRITGSTSKSFLLIVFIHAITCLQAILIAPLLVLSLWRIMLITIVNFATFLFFLIMFEDNMRKKLLDLNTNIKNIFNIQKLSTNSSNIENDHDGYRQCHIDLSPMIDALTFEEKGRAQILLSSMEELIKSNTRRRDLLLKSKHPGSFIMMLPITKSLNVKLFQSRISDILDWFFIKYNVKGPHQKLYKIKIEDVKEI